MVLLLLIRCLLLLTLFVGVLCLVLTLLCCLVLQSSWWGRESWLLYFNCLSDVLWLLVLCGSSSRCRGWVCSVWLWYFLIILIYFLVIHKRILLEKPNFGTKKFLMDLLWKWIHTLSVLFTYKKKFWSGHRKVNRESRDHPNKIRSLKKTHTCCFFTCENTVSLH